MFRQAQYNCGTWHLDEELMDFTRLERATVRVELKQEQGALELWRQGFGRGGINVLPLSKRVTEGMRKLKPRLARVFIQEFFGIYPEHDVFDWSKMDPFMESMAATG